MKGLDRPVRDVTPALEAIAWAQEMPPPQKILGAEDWLALGEFLSSLPAEVDPETLEDQPLIHQLLAGELALTLAACLPKAPFSGRLEKSGRAAISLVLPRSWIGRACCRQSILAAFAISWPVGPVAGRWPPGCHAAVWGRG